MSRYKGDKEITLSYYGRKAITAIYKGLRLVMQMGNFFTRDGELFVTKDDETFEVKDDI
jgi:hypothetical protein